MPGEVQVLENMAEADRDRDILILVNPTGADLPQHAVQVHPRLMKLKRCLHAGHAWVGHDQTLSCTAPHAPERKQTPLNGAGRPMAVLLVQGTSAP